MDLCILNIDQYDIGVPMDAVREVLIRPGISPLPLSPDFLIGVTGFRGMSLPVIELLPLLDSDPAIASGKRKNAGSRDRVVVCQNDQGVIGIRVDLLDRKHLSNELATAPLSHQLLGQLDIPDDSTLNTLNLSELFVQIKTQMKPHLEHVS